MGLIGAVGAEQKLIYVTTAVDPWAIVAALVLLAVAAYIAQKCSGQRVIVATAAICLAAGFVAAVVIRAVPVGNWLSLLQTALVSLTWPTLLAIILLRYRVVLIGLFDAIRVRIERGDTIEAGPRGIKLESRGAADPLHPSLVVGEVGENLKGRPLTKDRPQSPVPKKGNGENDLGIYLVHTARRSRDPKFPFRVRVFLEGRSEDNIELNQVHKVVYHHWSLSEQDPVITDRKTNFELPLQVWGEFNIAADVYLQGKPEPLKLQRYLNC